MRQAKFVHPSNRSHSLIVVSSQVSVESIQNIRTVMQLTKEDYFSQQYAQLLNIPFRYVMPIDSMYHQTPMQRIYRSAMVQAHVSGVLFSLSESVMHFVGAVISSFGSFLIARNDISFEDCIL